MKYLVTYEETLARTLIVEADSIADAEDKMMNAFECGDIELTAQDYLQGSSCISFIDEAHEDDYDWYGLLNEFVSDNS